MYDKAENIPVVFIMGPTATGKTDAAAYLSKQLPSELVSVDSSLVYKGMDIGTAKPDTDFLQEYPHHLIDIRQPDQTYSAADFVSDVTLLIEQITSVGKVPILVGGTSFYFSAVEKGIPSQPPADKAVRIEIDQDAERVGWQELHKQLAKLDPASANRIDKNDAQRIQRALEIIHITGKPVRPLSVKPVVSNPIIKVGMAFSDRKILHERADVRFQMMLEKGLLYEVEQLILKYPKDLPAFRMIGYRQAIEYINGDITKDVFIEKAVAATRQLSKRQLTWMRNQSNLIWWVDDENFLKKKYFELKSLLNACH